MKPLVSLLLLGSLATAQEPSSPTVAEDNTVRSEVLIAASIDEVRRDLADPVAAAGLSSNVIRARVISRGACDVVAMTVRGLTGPMEYTAKRCPTTNGWTETLVSSDDFDAHRAEWKVTPVPGGTLVTLTISIEPDVPVPQRVINSVVQSQVVQTLKNLVRRVAGR